MHGIDLLLQSCSISRTQGATRAIEALNAREFSAGTCHFYIKEAVEAPEGTAITLPDSPERARLTLAYLVQTAIRTNRVSFSVDGYNELLARAMAIKITAPDAKALDSVTMQTITTAPKPVEVVAVEPVAVTVSIPAAAPIVDAEPDIPAPMALPSFPVEKSGRGRKSRPDSNVNRAKALYDASPDKTRATIVALFQQELQLPLGTATTYYYNAKKG